MISLQNLEKVYELAWGWQGERGARIPVAAYEVIMKRRPRQLWWKYARMAIVAVSILPSVSACATARVPPVGADDPARRRVATERP